MPHVARNRLSNFHTIQNLELAKIERLLGVCIQERRLLIEQTSSSKALPCMQSEVDTIMPRIEGQLAQFKTLICSTN